MYHLELSSWILHENFQNKHVHKYTQTPIIPIKVIKSMTKWRFLWPQNFFFICHISFYFVSLFRSIYPLIFEIRGKKSKLFERIKKKRCVTNVRTESIWLNWLLSVVDFLLIDLIFFLNFILGMVQVVSMHARTLVFECLRSFYLFVYVCVWFLYIWINSVRNCCFKINK